MSVRQKQLLQDIRLLRPLKVYTLPLKTDGSSSDKPWASKIFWKPGGKIKILQLMEENKIFELGGKIDELPDGTVIILHHESDDPQKSTDRVLSMGYSLKLSI